MSFLPEIQRLLPQAIDAEKVVLASMLLGSDALEAMVERFGEDGAVMHLPAHVEIYQSITRVWAKKGVTGIGLVAQDLKDRSKLAAVGGGAYLSSLYSESLPASTVKHYVDIVEQKYQLRKIITHGTEHAARAYNEQDDVAGLIASYEAGIMDFSARNAKDDYQTSHEIVMDALQYIEDGAGRVGGISGIPTGYKTLDKLVDGLHETQMVVIAGRPGSGKTALAMNMAENMAIDHGVPVAVFSLEMSKKQLMHRMILGRAGVNWLQYRDGEVRERDPIAIGRAAKEIAAAPLYFNDKSAISPAYLGSVLRRWVKKFGVRVAVIDYLQLMRGNKGYKGDNRQAEVAECSSAVKALAKELNITIIVLSQLSREVEKRTGSQRGVPRISDIRESGSIEQDADIIGLLHREESYCDSDEEREKAEGKANLNIAKHRNGPTQDVALYFVKEFTRFHNPATNKQIAEWNT